MSRKANGSGFKMRSGNSTPFKQMGSQAVDTTGSNTGSSTYNQSYKNPQGVTMYRHPGGLSSSTKYDPSKEGVVARKIGSAKYDYMGQSIAKTPGEIRQLEGKIRAQVERMKKHERWKKHNEGIDQIAFSSRFAPEGKDFFWDQYQPSSGEDFSRGRFTEDVGPTRGAPWYKSTRG